MLGWQFVLNLSKYIRNLGASVWDKEFSNFKCHISIQNYEKSQTDKVDYTKKVKVDFVRFGFQGIYKSKDNNNDDDDDDDDNNNNNNNNNKYDMKPKP
jgi:hypothetical protein